ncbi:prepilin-type N-terminal cleavage/methylation domain-containing protein [Crocosphaera sp. UHCC 0190]|uniref:prepilin-type N-terminal cleavage/methylation domain-containing protein n=1 Tax=Crocosphaera sp. UHCC 0190 TaxID=3110246 RepID=UPI002B21E6DE|nr:prepilin-type N-terminal cleavage/methylation domain-containing protein [Crocosphaera sp. UHCC 0190]
MRNATHKTNQGMTLMEIMIVVVITGILAVVGAPSLMSILQGDQVQQGLDQVYSALQDSQKQAIRLSKQCTITLNKDADPPTISSSDTACLVSTNRELPDGVVMKIGTKLESGITFSFKGTTTASGTIVVERKSSKATDEKQCLVISNGLGIMRKGVYKGDTSSSVTADNCQTSI